MLIEKNTFNVLSSSCPFEKTCSAISALVSLRRRNFGAWESLGSSSVKMSQAFHDPSISFNFFYFYRKVNTFETPEMCRYLDSDV